MIPLSILDLSPVSAGSTAAQALRNSLDLARARRRPRLHALLGGRAPQPAGDREFGARDHDRADRCRHHASARRLGRGDAAQPRAADGGGALQGAGGAVSRPHRSRPRPRARHRPGHLLHVAAAPGHQRGGRFPRALQRIDAAGDARLSGRPSVPQSAGDAGGRHAAADLPARLVGLFGATCRPDRRGLFLRAPLRHFRRRRSDAALSRQFPALGLARQALRDPGDARRSAPTATRKPSAWRQRSI